MRVSFLHLAAGAALLAAASLAQADVIYHDPHPSLAAVPGSVSSDAWNQLNRPGLGCADSNCSTALLVAGITANVHGSGDAVLQRLSGSIYPAGFGLYGEGVLSFSDQTLGVVADTLVFQGVINNFDTAPFGLTLSYNGGSQALQADSISFVDTGLTADVYTYTWSLGGVDLQSYELALSVNFAQALAFQVDVTPVPEAGTTALMLAGLGALGFVGRRRLRRH